MHVLLGLGIAAGLLVTFILFSLCVAAGNSRESWEDDMEQLEWLERRRKRLAEKRQAKTIKQ